MAIPRWEVPPVTDGEWAEALRFYGRDKDDIQPETNNTHLFGPASELHSSPISSPQPKRALIHRDSSDSLEEYCESQAARSSHLPIPNRKSTQASVQSDHNGSLASVMDLLHPTGQTSNSPRTSFGSTDAINPVDLAMKDAQQNIDSLGIAYTVPGPRGDQCPEITEAEKRSGQAERQQLREHYEKHGWLPGPEASRPTRMRRKRAIRRLGLCCNQETSQQRQEVMARYAELAKSIFQASSSNVSILMYDEEVLWGSQPHEPPARLPVSQSICAHAVLREGHECTVIADVQKDWRFRSNPALAEWPYKFYASAPLRYQRNGMQIDIGALCIHDVNPRDTFDEREQSILLNLANMLVFQLCTLQSEIMAKKSSSMYENCIAFLRRSVTPQTSQEKQADGSARKKGQDKKGQDRDKSNRQERRKDRAFVASPLNRPRRASRVDSASSEPDPVLAVKTGPRDSHAAKRDADASDSHLFDDAAKTLRRILKADAVAIVNIDEYQLFIRRATGTDIDPTKRKIKDKTKESIIASFLQGKSWPEDIDPVIHYVPRSRQPGVTVLGTDSGSECSFHFNKPGAEYTLSEFLQTFLKSRHFWWDREDTQDDLSQRMMDLMPGKTQTALGTAFLTWEGKTKFAMFASWDRPPTEFGDSQTIALPFAWILGGCLSAAMAIRKIRSLELSQISYSNLQAHELRTPLHQILAITQLLRSSMNDLAETPHASNTSSLTTTQQIRDLLPFLDAIDTSGKTLHGIVDNILSFLDLKGKENMINPTSPSLLNSPTGATQSLEVMFEELIHDACEEDKRSRRANGLPMCHTETVFEIVPPLLGEQVTEDAGGALRRALSKILSNAYKFIEGEGCVEIYVDDVPDLLPPEGCEDLALTKRIKIKIVDNGKGMDPAFVREKLGEPWAKEDPYATGSGLSVHLAYRIIGLMGGDMQITSGPGQGCMVELEVPVPRRTVTSPSSPELASGSSMALNDPAQLDQRAADIELKRKVALVGFDINGPGSLGLARLAVALEHQYTKLGCDITDVEHADLVILDGRIEESADGMKVLESTPARNLVFLVGAEHEAHPDVLATGKRLGKTVRRFRKPATPSILRETLFPGQSKMLVADEPTRNGSIKRRINAPEQVSSHGRTVSGTTLVDGTPGEKPRPHFADETSESLPGVKTPISVKDSASACSIVAKLATLWKPRNMEMEDAVACLSLGDYFSSRKRTSLLRTPSNGSSGAPSTADSHDDSMSGLNAGSEGDRFDRAPPTDSTPTEEMTEEEAVPEELVKVLVVEDNMVNRKILVKILSSKLPIEVLEAEDGHAAVELFKELTSPAIVLLDINMPKMDGYQACQEMRAIEKAAGRKGSQIIAVTALSSEEERRRGLVECGMNQWHTKPCSKTQIHKIVEEARALLVEAKEEIAEVGLGLQSPTASR